MYYTSATLSITESKWVLETKPTKIQYNIAGWEKNGNFAPPPPLPVWGGVGDGVCPDGGIGRRVGLKNQ